MYTSTIARAARPASRAFSTVPRVMAAGDLGAPSKTGGQGDAFKQREKGQEDYAIRQREQQKLQELRTKIHEQQKHLTELSKHIDEITKDQGGEQK